MSDHAIEGGLTRHRPALFPGDPLVLTDYGGHGELVLLVPHGQEPVARVLGDTATDALAVLVMLGPDRSDNPLHGGRFGHPTIEGREANACPGRQFPKLDRAAGALDRSGPLHQVQPVGGQPYGGLPAPGQEGADTRHVRSGVFTWGGGPGRQLLHSLLRDQVDDTAATAPATRLLVRRQGSRRAQAPDMARAQAHQSVNLCHGEGGRHAIHLAFGDVRGILGADSAWVRSRKAASRRG